MELLGATLLLAFVTSATAALYHVGTRQQRNARFYSETQTDLKEALRRITRTIRHGGWGGVGVVMGSSVTNFAGVANSTASQIIVSVPQPNASGSDQVRIYVDGSGNVYAQRNDSVGAGILMLAGPSSTIAFRYWQTSVSSTGNIYTELVPPGTSPAPTTEVQITLTAKRGSVTTTSVAYVTLRNTVIGF